MKTSALIAMAMLLTVGVKASPTTPTEAANSSASGEGFDIFEFRVLGNSTLASRDIEAAVYPYLGPNRTLEDVEKARDSLVAVYRARGLGTVLVDIPEQAVDDAIVRLQVTEGRVESVRISGARYYSERKILAELPSVQPGKVPVLPSLQKELNAVAAESKDREVTPILKPGSTPGTVAVEFVVNDRLPLHGSVEVNNRYTADTSQLRASASLSYDNLFDRRQSLGLLVQTSPQETSQVQVAVLNYSGPTAWKDFSWSTYAIHSRSNVAAVGTLNVVGNGAIVGGRLNESLVAESTRVSALSYGVDFKNFQQNITLPDGTPAKTPVRYMLWSVQYNDFHHAERWDWQWNIGANWGIRGLVNEEQQFGYARYGAHAGFAYIRSAANIVRRLPKNWALAFRVAGQYAEQPLVNNEQFTLGGVDTVRGYLDAASLTDAGVAATFELRLPPATVHQLVIEPYLFFDRGSGLIQQPLLDQIKRGLVRSNLEGWGGGMRMRGPSGIELFLDVSTPLLDGTDLVGPKDHQVPRTPRGDTRLDFNVRYAY